MQRRSKSIERLQGANSPGLYHDHQADGARTIPGGLTIKSEGSAAVERQPDGETGAQTNHSVAVPTLKEIMVNDEDYIDFVAWRSSGLNYVQRSDQDFCSPGTCARCCAGFSFIGMMFLIFIGILIETQPLYVKGIKQKKNNIVYYYRQDNQIYNRNKYRSIEEKSETEEITEPSISINEEISDGRETNTIDSLRWLDQFYTPEHESNYHRDLRRKKKEYYGEHYDMHDQAKTSFKTATAYFLTMVLSLIYAQNHERFGWSISLFMQRIRHAIQLRKYFAIAYDSYRRRNYRDIDDMDTVAPTISMPNFDGGGDNDNDTVDGNVISNLGLRVNNSTDSGRSGTRVQTEDKVNLWSSVGSKSKRR